MFHAARGSTTRVKIAAAASTPFALHARPSAIDAPAINPAMPARRTDTSTSTTSRNSVASAMSTQARMGPGTRTHSMITPKVMKSTATLKPLIARKWLSPVAAKVCRKLA